MAQECLSFRYVLPKTITPPHSTKLPQTISSFRKPLSVITKQTRPGKSGSGELYMESSRGKFSEMKQFDLEYPSIYGTGTEQNVLWTLSRFILESSWQKFFCAFLKMSVIIAHLFYTLNHGKLLTLYSILFKQCSVFRIDAACIAQKLVLHWHCNHGYS